MSNGSWRDGIVAKGNGFGRRLGFPTANVELDERPDDGIYAVWARVGDKQFMGAMHVGPRPAIGDARPMVEIHLLDFDNEYLYDQTISFQVVEKIREVEDFETVEELRAAIARDVDRTRSLLGSDLRPPSS